MATRSSKILLFLGIMAGVIVLGLTSARAVPRISDRDFVREVAKSNMLQVSLGEMAEQRAASPDVKQFGRKMAEAHTLAVNKLQEIARKDHIGIPGDMDRQDHEMVGHHLGLKGRDFDLAYVKHMVNGHMKDLEMFEQMAAEGTNPDLRSYAEQTIPTLREHLQTAREILAELKVSG